MSCVRVLEETTENNKMCLNLQQEEELKQKLQNNNKKRELEKEKSSDSSTNSNSDSLFCAGAGNNAKTSASSGKLSKIGRRLRESCRNLRGKSAPASRHDPEEYTSIQAVNESVRSRHYVAMDFTGKVGKILDNKEFIRGYTSKDGYAYFRKKCTPKNLDQLLTESQAKVHLKHVWFHKGIGRDFAQRILATHNVDGLVYHFT